MADEVTIRATPARPFLAANSPPQVGYLLVDIQPGSVVASVRMPVNVGFVLDRSGSMKGEKIDRVRRATNVALDMLDAQDTVSVVIFDHRTEVLIPSTSVQNRYELQEKISRIRDAGGTKIAPAVQKALQEIQKGSNDAIRRLLLLTDGQTEHESECLLRADDAGRQSIPITALGVGNDWNEDLLIDMANRSGGTADYIDQPDKITDFFQNTVQRAQATAIQNATLTMRLVQGVTPRTVWQVIPMIDQLSHDALSDRDASVTLGELVTGQGRTLLVELLIETRPLGQYRICQFELNYDIPAMQLYQQHARIDVTLSFADDPSFLQQVNAPVMNTVEKISAFKLQTRALQDLQTGDVSAATQKLRSAVTRLLNQGELELAETMQQEVTNLESQGQMSSEGQKTIKFGTRKTVRLSDLDKPGDVTS
ncbi:MAG: VWA domain-containing protein [Chloroflexaceae bacterium]|nr:VWA domain-containing protein [Chloroflexaceae bacterium]